MSPNPSPRPPAATISVNYEHDPAGAAEALLALLRHPASPNKQEVDGTTSPTVSR
jgi:hypothetical protein